MTYAALLDVDNNVILRGDRCVTSLQELYKALIYKDTTDVEISKEFAEKYFTPSGLDDFIKNAASVNPHIRFKVSAVLKDYNMEAVNKLQSLTTEEELFYVLMTSPTKVINTIQMLCDSYKNAYSETLVANSKVSSLQMLVNRWHTDFDYKAQQYNRLMDAKNDLQAKLETIVARINYSYDKELDESKAFQLTANRFTKILYIKERTRVHYVDTVVYYLMEILKVLYSAPVRLAVIEPYHAYDNVKLYPYVKPHWDLTFEDVYRSDIFMAGFQPSLMEDILHNPSNVEFLIILDRGGFKVPHVYGVNVEIIFTMSDLRDNYDDMALSRIISYSPQTLNVLHIPGFDSLSPEEKISRYSSMPLMVSLLELMERRG
jgi:hypothetical protein